MTRVRALALRQEGRRNAALLEAIELDPAPYLNSVYLAVMFAQNGSAVLVAMLAEDYFADWRLTLVLVAFTLAYFVVVEAMSKTFGIQNSDGVALALAPVVWLLGRIFALPTRALIGIANILLPGKGLARGPFVSEEDIRSMADVGHEEGAIEEREKEMIHSVFHFGDRVVRELMVPRPDIVAVDLDQASVHDAHALVVRHGFTRIPAYRGSIEQIEGIVHAKDLMKILLDGDEDTALATVLRPAHFVPRRRRRRRSCARCSRSGSTPPSSRTSMDRFRGWSRWRTCSRSSSVTSPRSTRRRRRRSTGSTTSATASTRASRWRK
jgi:CBS domain containing-hemolysin-like protein